ncbi:hypothetical protein SEA_MUFASA8_9 [Arthrobacter phage Mufasa8]|uniref:Tail terminator n=1 Tax=Arthrobacter phage Mufasa8 TaxID=2656526 RepID=A0A649VN50_9CAUD|nr:hypothetical protein HYQ08_gp009 [Arthrobacter phage Mufasa8]QGJ93459.1 hypothetical protein SEA_MUFASA8_9 [Arthrobacter phage Mufasa8]
MGAAAIRTALASYIAPTTGITAMFRDEPWFITGEAWTTEDGLPGTVCYLHINEESETRITVTGSGSVGKRVDYKVGIIILYQYVIPDAPIGNDAWVDGLDQLIDALKARLRADPTMGTDGTVIWQAGQSDGDLRIRRDLPKLHGGKVHSWNVMELEVTEILTA